MPHQISLGSPFIRVRLSGTVSAPDLMAAAKELEQHEQAMGHIPDRLVDLSDMVAAGLTFHVAMEAARHRRIQTFPNSFRSALYAPTEASMGFAKIFSTLNINPQIEMRIFTVFEEAEAWLRSPREDDPLPHPARRRTD